ncbi:MAG: sigma-54-dependent Fis family transcriptional regulator [Deltaproteobacteria bacterium]|nr:sigma-54-dependent Fis family transcriptional regulator [Deltaproteobacteria bacterium]
MANILIIDDDEMLCDMLCRQFERMGYHVAYALNIEDGAKRASSEDFDVVFLDVRLPDGNGIDALPGIRGVSSSPEVIIFTAEGDPDGAELAIRSGAWDYIEKPPSVKEMTLPLIRALQYRDERKKRRPRAVLKPEGIIGSSKQLGRCLDLLAEAAGSEENVLITGETGTGKELFATAIHKNSNRSKHDFVVVDCSALPETLVESMLFGHEKGAFTGANKAYAGLIKQADRGTLFLDEVGELPLSLQKTFLRVLQERRFRPLGGREIESDFRLVAATNRDLDDMTKEGRFRDDLLFRLKSLAIELPPLRERPDDIKEIAMNRMNKRCELYGTPTKGFSPEFLEALISYDWPGNVRELVNALERVFVSARHAPTLFPKHLPDHIRIKMARASVGGTAPVQGDKRSVVDTPGILPTLKNFRRRAFEDLEQKYLQDLISQTDGDIKEACRISRLSQSRLYGLLKHHKTSRPD